MTREGMAWKEIEYLAKQFRALQKLLSAAGDFKSMQTATVCAGLAEVCEDLALASRHKRLEA